MFPVDTEAAAFILLMNETRTVSLEYFLLPSSRMEGKYSPCSRIRAERPARQIGNASLKQKSSRELLANHSLERHRSHGPYFNGRSAPGKIPEPF